MTFDDHIAVRTLYEEIWKKVPDFPKYEVSSLGRVRRCVGGTSTYAGKILKPKMHRFGYPRVTLRENNVPRDFEVSRLMALVFLGKPPTSKHQAAHNDGNPKNNVLGNIRWATPKENNADKFRHGTAPIGSNNGMSKITERDAIKIRALRKRGLKLKEIGDKFGLSFQAISKIVNNQRWRQV